MFLVDEKNNENQEETSLEITDLTPQLQRFVHLYTTGQYSITKIAELLEVHPNTVHRWLNRRDVKDVITEMQKVTHEVVNSQMKALTAKAVNRLNDLVDSQVDGVALQAVNSVLDRGGHKTKNEISVEKTVKTYEEKLDEVIDTTIEDLEVEEGRE